MEGLEALMKIVPQREQFKNMDAETKYRDFFEIFANKTNQRFAKENIKKSGAFRISYTLLSNAMYNRGYQFVNERESKRIMNIDPEVEISCKYARILRDKSLEPIKPFSLICLYDAAFGNTNISMNELFTGSKYMMPAPRKVKVFLKYYNKIKDEEEKKKFALKLKRASDAYGGEFTSFPQCKTKEEVEEREKQINIQVWIRLHECLEDNGYMGKIKKFPVPEAISIREAYRRRKDSPDVAFPMVQYLYMTYLYDMNVDYLFRRSYARSNGLYSINEDGERYEWSDEELELADMFLSLSDDMQMQYIAELSKYKG